MLASWLRVRLQLTSDIASEEGSSASRQQLTIGLRLWKGRLQVRGDCSLLSYFYQLDKVLRGLLQKSDTHGHGEVIVEHSQMTGVRSMVGCWVLKQHLSSAECHPFLCHVNSCHCYCHILLQRQRGHLYLYQHYCLSLWRVSPTLTTPQYWGFEVFVTGFVPNAYVKEGKGLWNHHSYCLWTSIFVFPQDYIFIVLWFWASCESENTAISFS